MTMNKAQLIEIIKQASQAYYSGQPIMSDTRFDQYMTFLKALDPTAEVLLKTGHGYDPTTVNVGDKISHPHGGMGSIDCKPKEFSDIPVDLRHHVRVSAKLDGLSGVIHVVDGEIVRCLTRGDGVIGIDKTDKFKAIESRYGHSIPKTFTGEIRGEFIISNENWKIMVDNGSVKKNPRNAASGIINQKDINNDINYLDFIPYKIIYDPNAVLSEHVWFKFDISKWFPNFPKLPYMLCEDYSLDELTDFYFRCKEVWPCDGAVITSEDIEVDSGKVIYNECAYKFETLKAITKIKDIEWNLSKQNYYIPTAILDPVEIGGSTISRATLFNAKFVVDNRISKGATVLVLKAGDIIPKIEEVLDLGIDFSIPQICPVCGNPLSSQGVHIVCTNPECNNTSLQDLKIWCMNIGIVGGFSETLLFKYLDRFGIHTISDIYNSSIPIESLKSEGVQSNKFIEIWNKLTSFDVQLSNLLKGLNIPRLGEVTVNKLIQNKDFIQIIKDLEIDFNINDSWKTRLYNCVEYVCGEATAKSFLNNEKRLRNLKYAIGRIIYPNPIENVAEVKYLCVTGKLNCGSRKDFENLVKPCGFELKEEVSKKVSYLITNSTSSSSKTKKAAELGIDKLTEDEFIQKFINKN